MPAPEPVLKKCEKGCKWDSIGDPYCEPASTMCVCMSVCVWMCVCGCTFYSISRNQLLKVFFFPIKKLWRKLQSFWCSTWYCHIWNSKMQKMFKTMLPPQCVCVCSFIRKIWEKTRKISGSNELTEVILRELRQRDAQR